MQMSLADGLAAVVGLKYGAKNAYRIAGNKKSIIGTFTFLIVSFTILTIYALHFGTIGIPVILSSAVVATLIENISPFGLDNLLVPLLVALMLHGF
jgi:phytol kinase